ncbi:ATPase domain-containing protein [Helicobacter ailurogastricus]|uniref:KaiC-like domain-containing protein n=1 Tax=Helicobacter ailurogastricus TaxID=1578720 RepID=A0A0K2Y466_9HELI|nr:ATPase domain-containing protein [Helicobacter ailurogastricus]BDQ28951.1 hypothetical protein ASB7_07880 [Helicobacter ailurogastricus]CRI32459.1 hypothetical protein HAL07_09340 [Helicobacter ailurogastricus]
MEKLVVHSLINFPQDLEEFLEGIPLEFLEPAHRKIIDAVIDLSRDKRLITRETLLLELGEGFCQSQDFLEVFNADCTPDYINLKEDFKKFLALKVQRKLANELAKASLNSEIYDLEFINRYISIEPSKNGALLSEYIKRFADMPPLAKLSTGVSFFDEILGGGFEVGRFVLVSGDAETGKTLLCQQFLEFMALEHKVCYFSFEFPVRGYVDHLLRRKFYFNPDNLYLDGDSQHLNDLSARIKSLARKGFKAFLIDSQMRVMGYGDAINSKEEFESSKFTVLSSLAKSLEVLIILIIQNSKDDEFAPFGSKKGSHEADIMFRISRLKKFELKRLNFDEEHGFLMRKITTLKNKQTGLQTFKYFRIDQKSFKFVHIEGNRKGQPRLFYRRED